MPVLNPAQGSRDARRCAVASLALFLVFVGESQAWVHSDHPMWLQLVGLLTVGLWCAATLFAAVLYFVIFFAWVTAWSRNRR